MQNQLWHVLHGARKRVYYGDIQIHGDLFREGFSEEVMFEWDLRVDEKLIKVGWSQGREGRDVEWWVFSFGKPQPLCCWMGKPQCILPILPTDGDYVPWHRKISWLGIISSLMHIISYVLCSLFLRFLSEILGLSWKFNIFLLCNNFVSCIWPQLKILLSNHS